MESRLKQFQSYIEKYIEIIASVLNIDIEIVDDKLIRIGGTGIYKNKVNENVITEGNIYSEVLETSKEVVVLDIEKNSSCVECSNFEQCINKSIIVVPIKYDNQTIGVVGAVSTDIEKKKHIKSKIDSYLPFIENICDLISMKIEEHEVNKDNSKKMQMFHEVINNVEKSILILDTQHKISYINDIAIKCLKLSNNQIGEVLNIINCESYTNGKELITINIGGNQYKITAKTIPVYPYIKSYDKIIIFDKVNEQVELPQNINTNWGINNIESIVGNSYVMQSIKHRIKKLSKSNSTVLITGESGTGKELIARAIHAEGNRRNKPFIAINCAAIPENLLESELFGYVKGAFSGASNSGKIGKFEFANMGVIFLDEIGDLSFHLQAKLLRVLQERKFARIGSNKLIDLDIKVIAATNKDLLKLVSEGLYRDDLYYRLNVIPINLPPLRERKEDIKDLINMFMPKYSVELNINLYKIEDSVIKMLENYYWPGNIRELENAIEYMMNLVGEDGIITTDMLPIDIINYYKKKNMLVQVCDDEGCLDVNLQEIDDEIMKYEGKIISIKDLELIYINKLLDKYGRTTKTKKEIAKKLGIGLATLYRKLEEN
ncbi:AAA family ATPase [Romboutsia weinsteinii]|uniref:AAA family ATPase n=1 Tax=Romboutsia weinsteinii TaxID=2020949 RepID=A0A371J0X5_9FIRM|nr:sigma 54-interacting transcriptional regulator [Romboutsia weinsteinii]RDY26419.1 AAA family ATPase [Romboutsia weinsteinii]